MSTVAGASLTSVTFGDVASVIVVGALPQLSVTQAGPGVGGVPVPSGAAEA